jgi:predicted enzyme related to lactoylglutathione lyase
MQRRCDVGRAGIGVHCRTKAWILPGEGGPMDFNSILIGSEDPARLVEFYKRLFGEPVYADESYSTWQLGSGFVSVGPHSQVTGKNPQPGRLIWNIETTDVKGEFERLKAAGATVVAEPYSFEGFADSWIATFADPDDNYFQLMTPMPM